MDVPIDGSLDQGLLSIHFLSKTKISSKNGLKQYEEKDGFLHNIVTFAVNISWNLTLFRGQEYVRD